MIYIGIDFGTTNSCVSYYNTDTDSVEVLVNEDGNMFTKSIIGFKSKHVYYIGDEINFHKIKPENCIKNIKRIIGLNYSHPYVQSIKDSFNYNVVQNDINDDLLIELDNGERLTPIYISSLLLNYLYSIVQTKFEDNDIQTVITIPAYYTDNQRKAIWEAINLSTIKCERIINEPTAACLSYNCFQNLSNENLLIFDLGGGTLDLSIVNVTNNIVEVVNTFGNSRLGGEDYTKQIMNHILDYYNKSLNEFTHVSELDLESLSSLQLDKLYAIAERLKKQINIKKTISIEIDFLPNDFVYTLCQDTYLTITNYLNELCLNSIRSILKNSNLTQDTIYKIILIGGSTRNVFLYNSIKSNFNIPIENKINPDEAVSRGATLLSLSINNQKLITNSKKTLVLDIIPFALGIETECGLMSIIINKQSTIPIKKTMYFTTTDDNQRFITLNIYEGESIKINENVLLYSTIIENIPLLPRGVPKIEITFKINQNGILEIHLEENQYNIKHSFIIDYNKNTNSNHLDENSTNLDSSINSTIDELINKRCENLI
jgi:molecular chaperone DnaK (HSP70)